MKEQLSALIDGEMAASEAQHLILAARSNSEIAGAWREYHLIGDVLRGEFEAKSNLSNILQALESEPTVFNPAASNQLAENAAKPQNWLPKWNAWSVAASVAAMFFVGLVALQNQNLQNDTLAPVQIAQDLPIEYLNAHQAVASNTAAYYVQPANFVTTTKQ